MRAFETHDSEGDINNHALSNAEAVYSILSANLIHNKLRSTVVVSKARRSELERAIDRQETALLAYRDLYK